MTSLKKNSRNKQGRYAYRNIQMMTTLDDWLISVSERSAIGKDAAKEVNKCCERRKGF